MKLYDRSVDLAKFEEDTPLYPICRAWMANNSKKQHTIVKYVSFENTMCLKSSKSHAWYISGALFIELFDVVVSSTTVMSILLIQEEIIITRTWIPME